MKKESVNVIRIKDKHHYLIYAIDYRVKALKSCPPFFSQVSNSRGKKEVAIEQGDRYLNLKSQIEGVHNKLKWVINFAKIGGYPFPFIRNLGVLTISALKIVTVFSLLFPFHLFLT